jgi:membrane protease YdiL (CAAX protease family)
MEGNMDERMMGKLKSLGEIVLGCALYYLVCIVSISFAPADTKQTVACLLFWAVLVIAFFLGRRLSPHSEGGFFVTLKGAHISLCLCALLGGLALNMLFSGLLPLLPFPKEWFESYSEASGALAKPSVMRLIDTVVFIPIFEESFYRGIVFDRFTKLMPTPIAIILASVVFGFAHTTPIWIAYASIISLVICLIYHSTRSLLPCVLFHIAFNGTNYILPTRTSIEGNFTVFLIGLLCTALCVTLFVFFLVRTRTEARGRA